MDLVYLDSSVIVELLLGSKERRQTIKSFIAGKRRFTSVISFGEVLYVVLAISAEKYYGSRSRNAIRKFVKEKHDHYIILHESVCRTYSTLNIDILPHPKVKTLNTLIRKYSLLPRDLIHIATAIENNCNTFLTLDDDFKQVRENIDIVVIE